MEFKGTKGKFQKVYVSDVCIGIGVVVDEDSGYTEMTANSILPEVGLPNKKFNKEIVKMEADMTLYSKSYRMLEMLQDIVDTLESGDTPHIYKINELIKEATTI